MISQVYKDHVQNCSKCWKEDGIVPCPTATRLMKGDELEEAGKDFGDGDKHYD